MSLVVDTGVLYAQHDSDASRHESAQAAMEAVARGKYGRPSITEHIYDETVTLTQARTGRHSAARLVGEQLRERDLFRLLVTERALFEAAVDVFERYDDHGLSFTDATTIALVEERDIDHVLSFDDDFDGIVDRLDPREVS
jgi:predicted nucleic acid-binding protein